MNWTVSWQRPRTGSRLLLSLRSQMEFPTVGKKGTCGTLRQLLPACALFATKGAGRPIDLTSRVQAMSYCIPLPANCFSAEESPHLVDMKATTRVVLLS